MISARRLLFAALVLVSASACSSKPSHKQSSQGEPKPQQIDPPSAPGSLGGNLSRDGDAVLATWLEPAAADGEARGSTRRGPHRVRFARFAGGAWSEPVTIAEGDSVFANWADTPSVVRGGDGALVAHWAQRSEGGPYAYDVALARSTDDGAKWKHLGLAHDDGTATEHGFVSLVPVESGVRAFWLDGREMAGGAHGGHGSGPMTLRTALVGDAVTEGEVVDPRVCDCCGTTAVSAGAGVVVAYRDRSADEVRDVWVARRDAGGWSAPSAVHDDGWKVPGCPVNGPALAADGDRLAAAWYTYAGERGSVRVAFSNDGGRSFAAPIEVDGPQGRVSPIGRVDVELLAGDEAVVTWMSSDREDAAVLGRRVTAAGRVGPAVRLLETQAARDAGFPRLVRAGGDALGLLYTAAGDRTRVRFQLIPLAAVGPADALPPPPQAAGQELLALGSRAPSFEMKQLDGTRGSLADLGGNVTLVNVWATWCEPCRHELPVLAQLQERYADEGLRVIAISVDRDRSAEELAAFAERRKLPFQVWHDAADRSSGAFGIGALPASFLFDRSGRLVWRHAGGIREGDDSLRSALETTLSSR